MLACSIYYWNDKQRYAYCLSSEWLELLWFECEIFPVGSYVKSLVLGSDNTLGGSGN